MSRLGVSGVDPFIKYLFETTDRERRQLSHRERTLLSIQPTLTRFSVFDDSKMDMIAYRDLLIPFALEDGPLFISSSQT
jgi:hypothetical protein